MILTSFSFLTSIIWVSVFAVSIKLLSRQMVFLRSFSIYPLIFLICLCLIKVFLPIELFYTQIIRSEKFLPALQRVLSYRFISLFDQNVSISILNILIILSTGVACNIIYKKIGEYKRFYRVLCILAVTKDKRINTTLTRVLKLICIKKEIKIIVHKEIKTPAIVGFRSPIIILPDLIFTDDELLGILMHECQHYRQGHIIIKCVSDIIQAIFWWNPLFKHLNNEVEHTLEMHSDEKVSLYLNKNQQQSYLNAIIKVVQNQKECKKKSILACCLVEEAESNRLKQRFKMLLEGNYSKINKQRSTLFIPIMFVLLFLSYTFVIQPYSSPSIQDYGLMTDISNNDYLVKTDSGYNLYNDNGELMASLIVIDDNLKHLKILNKEDIP